MAEYGIVHLELSANEPDSACRFYADLFGWKIQSMPEMGYVMFSGPAGTGGGFNKVGDNPGGGSTPTKAGDVVVYFSTDDIEATLAKAESLGGTQIVPKMEIPGMGWFAIFRDPTGNNIGLYTALGEQAG